MKQHDEARFTTFRLLKKGRTSHQATDDVAITTAIELPLKL